MLDEHPICQKCGRRPSEEADHIVPVDDGGGDEGSNLQALCIICHDEKTLQEATGRRSGSGVVLVAGPPGSGKTTYVKRRHRVGEVVLDLDEIFAAVSLLDPHAPKGPLRHVAQAMAASAKDLIAAGVAGGPGVWIVSSAATEGERQRAASPLATANNPAGLVVLEVAADVCLGRIQQDGRTDMRKWQQLVERWWNRYEPPVYGSRWRKMRGTTR